MERDCKKAIAPIISFVLLLGFAIGIASMVYTFSVKQAETLSEKGVSFVSGKMGCENVYLNVKAEDGCSDVTVLNNGMFDVKGLVVRSFSQLGAKSVVDEVLVNVKKDTSLTLGLINADKIEVIPLLKVGKEFFGCKDKLVSISCEGLSALQEFACEQADPDNCGDLAGTGIVTCEECNTLGLCNNC